MTSRQAEVLMHGTSRGESEPQNSEPLNFQSLNKDALAESGRGLQIIHDLMDEVTYARNVEGNCLTLTKRIGETNRR
jgi:anti-sigma regulatory factor (Ser/Thr protein kinase)